jgi:hypothetical protein
MDKYNILVIIKTKLFSRKRVIMNCRFYNIYRPKTQTTVQRKEGEILKQLLESS